VELAKGQKLANGKTGSGWIVKDPAGRNLRRFFDTDGDNQIDVWSYYLNGEEVYREIDSNLNGKVDQYRWLGANGSKWGADLNEDGVIDAWKAISAEEVSQEIFAAVMAKDFARLQALMITKADMDALELPEAEAARIKAKTQSAATTFQSTCAALAKLTDKTRWVHLETGAPECTPADALGSKADLVRHKSGTILYSDGEKTHDFLQTGELIQVGRAWKIIEAPVPGTATTATPTPNSSEVAISGDIKAEIEELKPIDDRYKDKSTPKDIVEYNLARAAVLERIVAKMKTAKDREEWLKQVADCYSTAAQNNDKPALAKLNDMLKKVVAEAPNGNLAAYVAYRHMSAEYAVKLEGTPAKDMAKLQEEWKERLTKFVSDFPASEDTPDAVMQLAMVGEFVGKDVEAKNWYAHLAKNFANSPMAPKAAGALRRLNAEGQPFELASTALSNKAPFDIKSLKGKAVIVYYWASWNQQCADDFAKLKKIVGAQVGQGVELVCVNLDATPAEATKFLAANPVPAIHLHETGGLESPPAIQYGIMVLPNMFLVGPNGIVIDRNAQVSSVEDEIKKLLK
jgi:thiol-disulfide isomerase/thioredoxin